jgi:hypothetical protein
MFQQNQKKIQIHIDCDNGWVYANDLNEPKFHDISIYQNSISKFLDLLEEFEIKAVFFVVGKDLKNDPRAVAVLNKAIAAGHLIGNHTYEHSINFCNLSNSDTVKEIQKNHFKIMEELQIQPKYFRAPGYIKNEIILENLVTLGYEYESSTYPGLYPKILNLYFKLIQSSKRVNSRNRTMESRELNIQKIATSTKFKIPIHSTILCMIPESISRRLLQKINNESDCYLFHGIDLIDEFPGTSKHPMSKLSFNRRVNMIKSILGSIKT